eukprot:31383-Pelagococcus_subviridis.AAC.16
MRSIPNTAAATERFNFLNVPPPSLPRRDASRSTNCTGASMNTAPRPNARCTNCDDGLYSFTMDNGDSGENANAPPTTIDAQKLSL